MHTAFEFNHILALDAFAKGKIVVQDVSSMLVAEVADPKKGDYAVDVKGARWKESLLWGGTDGGIWNGRCKRCKPV